MSTATPFRGSVEYQFWENLIVRGADVRHLQARYADPSRADGRAFVLTFSFYFISDIHLARFSQAEELLEFFKFTRCKISFKAKFFFRLFSPNSISSVYIFIKAMIRTISPYTQ